MRAALLLLFLALVAGCPRQTNETVAQTPARPADLPPVPVQQAELAARLEPPIPYLALASEMQPAALPAEVVAQYHLAALSEDGSSLSTQPAGAEPAHWCQAFTTPADEQALLAYFGGLLQVKGFSPEDPEDEQASRPRFDHSWRSPEGRYLVNVRSLESYSGAADLTRAYLIHIEDLGGLGQGGTGP